MSHSPGRSILSLIMDLLVLLAIAEAARLVVLFFGSLESQSWARVIIDLTDYITLPLGAKAIATPYGGIFDVEAAVSVVAILALEWFLSMGRSRA